MRTNGEEVKTKDLVQIMKFETHCKFKIKQKKHLTRSKQTSSLTNGLKSQ